MIEVRKQLQKKLDEQRGQPSRESGSPEMQWVELPETRGKEEGRSPSLMKLPPRQKQKVCDARASRMYEVFQHTKLKTRSVQRPQRRSRSIARSVRQEVEKRDRSIARPAVRQGGDGGTRERSIARPAVRQSSDKRVVQQRGRSRSVARPGQQRECSRSVACPVQQRERSR